MNEPKVGGVARSVRFGQEEYMKPEQDAILTEADEENELSSALTTSLERSCFGKL